MLKSPHIAKYTLAAGAALLMAACGGENKEHKDKQTYKTMVVTTTDQTLNSNYTARLQGRQIVEVRPQVNGTLTRICINEGDKVKRGQLLFVIDQVPYEAALKVAKANVTAAEAKLATAKLDYENNQALGASLVVGEYTVKTAANALHEAEAALAQARAQELNARNSLSYTMVKSPVDGVASMIPWHVGALVSSSSQEPLVTVADDSEICAYFSMSDKQSLDLIAQYGSLEAFIRQAPAVSLLLSNGKEYGHTGRIDAVSGMVDKKTGAVTLIATFANPQHLLHDGSSATVVVPTHRKGCIVVPQDATFELQNRTFVHRIVDGKTKATAVEVFRLNNGKDFIVESGLSAGDSIIAAGAGLVKEGVEVCK